MSRVLSTEQAKGAIAQVRGLVNGGSGGPDLGIARAGQDSVGSERVRRVVAARFRGWTWPGTEAALDNAKQEHGGLRVQVRKVSQDIFSAGGGV